MKKSTLFAICIALIFTFLDATTLHAQSINWLWARNDAGTGDADQGQSVAIDSKGNVLVAGYFDASSITFGANTLNNVSAGTYDVYVVKYSPAGTVLWAKSAGGTNSDYGYAVSADSADNVYVSGYFKSPTITFGANTLTNGHAGTGDSFIVKYDKNGNVIWAKNDVSGATSNSMNTHTNTLSSVYGAGNFQAASITYGSQTVNNANAPNVCPYLVKFSPAGTAIWAVGATGNTANDNVISVSADTKGNVFLAGYFLSSSITFGSNTLNNTASYNDMFLVKYDTNGNVIWAKNAGGSNGDAFALAVAADGTGSVYISGDFKSSTMTIGSTVLNNAGFGSGYSTTFIAKYDANGNVLWANTTGGAAVSNAMGGLWANSKGVYGVGGFQGSTIQFGTFTLNNPNAPNQSPYIVKYDALGNAMWASNPTGETSLANNGISVAATNSGDVSITGYFASSSLTFGTAPAITNASAGTNDMFVAYLYDSTATLGINEIVHENNVSVYPNPATNQVVFKTSLENPNVNYYVEMFDVTGQTVKTVKLYPYMTTVATDGMARGMYFYRIMKDNISVKNGKLVLQ